MYFRRQGVKDSYPAWKQGKWMKFADKATFLSFSLIVKAKNTKILYARF